MPFTKEEEEKFELLIKILTNCQNIPETKALADDFFILINSNLSADETERKGMILYNKIAEVLERRSSLEKPGKKSKN